jgi:hypothetical protein
MRKYFISILAPFFFTASGYSQLVFEWTKIIETTGNLYPVGIDLDSDGNIFTGATFTGITDLDPDTSVFNVSGGSLAPPFYYNSYVEKLDSAGNFIWGDKFGDINHLQCTGMDVDDSGNVIITGFFEFTADVDPSPSDTFMLTSNGGSDIFICKIDNDGNFVWAKQMGAFGNDQAKGITTDAAGNVYITGYFVETVDFDPGPGIHNLTNYPNSYSPYVLKLDAAGDFAWAVSFYGGYGTGNSLSIDPFGNIYCFGMFSGPNDFDPGPGTVSLTTDGSWDLFVAKLNNAGGLIWAKPISGNGVSYPKQVNAQINNGFMLSGTFENTADFDMGPGINNVTASPGSQDPFLVKYDSAGNFGWITFIGPNGNGTFQLDNEGSVYLNGSFSGTIDVDPDAGVYNLTSVGSGNDAYLVKLDSSAHFQWAKHMSSTAFSDFVSAGPIAVEQNALYTTGTFRGTCDLNPDAGVLNFTTPAGLYGYIQELSTVPLAGLEYTEVRFSIYPNPAQESITLDLGNFYESGMRLEISDVHGKLMYAENINGETTKSIPVDSFIPGIYFTRIISSHSNYCKKLIVE